LVEFDARQLEIALTNIMANALKYTPANGEIILKTSQSETQIFLTISDTGPGIPPEDMEYLFSMFYPAGAVLNPKQGTGIGLFIAQEIIKAHGGKISVKSKIGRGSTFIVALPKSSMHRLISEI
jgi:two-component system sensor histidine kinase ResE